MIEAMVQIITVFWMLRIVFNILTYAELWWVKEYRWDRMVIHLRTPQGKRILWPGFRRPPISPKSTLLVALSLIVTGCIVWVVSLPLLIRLAIADLLSFPVTWILVYLLNVPTKIYHSLLILLAVRKLRSHKPMTVIGVTGSYGKTSVKDYLATILSSKFTVVKTEASKNSPIGIAEVILNTLKPEHEVFVVEMGAYRIGEIEKMASMVKPHIGIITAINPQHQDLFGSLENTMKAKYELIEGLEGRRIAIFNADDDRVRTMAGWARRDGCDVWGVTAIIPNPKFQIPNNGQKKFFANNITATFDGIEFMCASDKEKARVSAPVIGAHQVGNILIALAGAVAAGMTVHEAARAAIHIRPTPKVLEITPGVNGSTFVNDTFNNNPDSAKAALDVLRWGKRKKFLVFQPMIELGSYAASSHREVGEHAARICDAILLTNNNFFDPFIQGIHRVSPQLPTMVMDPKRIASFLKEHVTRGDTVLFKGKEAEHVLHAL